ncbi:MAG: complex I subunit 1 family protein [Candidatus Freyarchaeum deiterrae]
MAVNLQLYIQLYLYIKYGYPNLAFQYLLQQQSNPLLDLFKIIIFPGILFVIGVSLFAEWYDRKLYARLQNRVGPFHTGYHGVLQPVADLVKLLAKEDVVQSGAEARSLAATPIIAMTLGLVMLMFIPIYTNSGVISFEGDLIALLFLSTIFALTVILTGWFSTNRFAEVGTARAGMQLIAYEIPFVLSAITPAIILGYYYSGPIQVNNIMLSLGLHYPSALATLSTVIPASGLSVLTVANITQLQSTLGIPFILLAPVSFAVFIISLMAEMEKVPFDIPEAHTEIVAGWQTEISGRKLAIFRLSADLEYVWGAGLAAALFLGGPWGPGSQIGLSQLDRLMGAFPWGYLIGTGWFLVKVFAIIFVIANLRTLFARFRIDQVVKGSWKYLIPLAFLNIIALEVVFYFDLLGWQASYYLMLWLLVLI